MRLLNRGYLKNAARGVRSICLPRFKVLAYHSVNGQSRDPYEITGQDFAEQMKFLAASDYRVITLQTALNSLKQGKIGKKTVVLTFDDGFKSLHEHAFPVLRDYGFPATVFLPVKYVGGIDRFSYKEPRPTMPILNWREIEQSLSHGIEYGSHTMTHPNLLDQTVDELEYEIGTSRNVLAKRLGVDFFPFAYPFGLFNQEIKERVRRAGYHCALCFGNILSNSVVTDHYELKREKVLQCTSLDQFKVLVNIRNDLIRKAKKMLS